MKQGSRRMGMKNALKRGNKRGKWKRRRKEVEGEEENVMKYGNGRGRRIKNRGIARDRGCIGGKRKKRRTRGENKEKGECKKKE